MIDQLIRAIYDFTTTQLYPLANPSAAEKVALVAVGGYGRAELAPYSDIDLLFLLPYKLTPHCEQVVEYILYRLWDLGLKVGQSTRSIDECLARAKGDLTILTALLEARYLWGEQELFDKFRKRFHKECVAGQGEAFYQAKLNERRQRHEKFGPSRYALEPNIKEGKGGLRDLQTLRWIGRFLYGADTIDKLVEQGVLTADAAHRFDKAEAYLWVLRCHLHFLRGRARGEADLRHPARDRAKARLSRPRRQQRGRAADEALLPHRQVGGRADALLLHRGGGAACEALLHPPAFDRLAQARAGRLRPRWRTPVGAERQAFRQASAGPAAHLPRRAEARPRHPAHDLHLDRRRRRS